MANQLRDSNRDIRNSIYKHVSTLFSAPTSGGSSFVPYTVYGETELVQAQAGTLTRVWPSLFLVDNTIRPVKIALPLVAIETTIVADPFELGNDAGIGFMSKLHCFGRNLNEGSLLAFYLMKNFRPLKIYDFSEPASPVLRETALLDPRMPLSRGSQLSEQERQSGAYEFWFIVEVRGQIRDN